MKAIKILSIIILTIIGLVLCSVLVINIIGYKSNIANNITGSQIKAVKIGMTLEQVISILGKPYEIDGATGFTHNFNCPNPKQKAYINADADVNHIIHTIDSIYNDIDYCCAGYKDDKIRHGKWATLTYTKPVRIVAFYPMLWLHFDNNLCVESVVAKRYNNFFDDSVIYDLDCDNEENPFIDEELFNKCFPF